MWIDVLVLVILVTAAINGFRKGLIYAFFSFVGLVVGLAAALKLSAVVANYLRERSQWDSSWWPFIAFGVVFIVVVVLVRMVAGLMTKTVEFAMLGWINRLGGFLFYALINLLVLSIVLYFANHFGWLDESVKSKSISYTLLEPLGPGLLHGLGKFIPVFRDVFEDLQKFFEGAGKKIA